MPEKINMCTLHNPCRCKDCGNELLFFTTARNTLIDYKALFANGRTSPEIYRELQDSKVRLIRCIVCNKSYIIDWSNKFPEQLTNREGLAKFWV